MAVTALGGMFFLYYLAILVAGITWSIFAYVNIIIMNTDDSQLNKIREVRVAHRNSFIVAMIASIIAFITNYFMAKIVGPY